MEDERVLLHCCCGPCALYPIQTLREEGFTLTAYFDNPNIHPYREFQARREAFYYAAAQEALPTIDRDAYGLTPFMEAIHEAGGEVYQAQSESRCRICYRLRLRRTAAACKAAGLQTFSTTLLVSPYQHHALVREEGEAAARAAGLSFLYRDFRDGFRTGQAKAREMGLYRQGYCGCVFSEYERYGKTRTS